MLKNREDRPSHRAPDRAQSNQRQLLPDRPDARPRDDPGRTDTRRADNSPGAKPSSRRGGIMARRFDRSLGWRFACRRYRAPQRQTSMERFERAHPRRRALHETRREYDSLPRHDRGPGAVAPAMVHGEALQSDDAADIRGRCHEGNSTLGAILRGARLEDRERQFPRGFAALTARSEAPYKKRAAVTDMTAAPKVCLEASSSFLQRCQD